MNKIKSVLEFLKGFGKFVFTTMTGKVFIWSSVIMLGIAKLAMVLEDIAFETEFGKARSEANTNTDTEE